MAELAEFLKEYGGWGVAVVEMGIIAILFKAYQQSVNDRISTLERVLPLIEELRAWLRPKDDRPWPFPKRK